MSDKNVCAINLQPVLQIRGDPAVRQFVFEQERVTTDFDRRLNEVIGRVGELIVDRGVFHAKIHFSTGQVSLWLLSDPLSYRVYVKEEFLQASLLDVCPHAAYSERAQVMARDVWRVLDEFKRLRTLDPHIYLRSGSLNIVNGKVGLNFSCDGTHYLHYADFLNHAHSLYTA